MKQPLASRFKIDTLTAFKSETGKNKLPANDSFGS